MYPKKIAAAIPPLAALIPPVKAPIIPFEDTSDTILTCLDCYVKDKPFSQKWTSPKTLLPLQTGRDTGYGFMELAKEIQKNAGC